MTRSDGTEHLLARLTRTEITRRAPAAVAVVPVGATEQHGPHLPVGTDHLLVETIAARAAIAAAERADVLVAPTLPYGFSAHHVGFGGTVTLSMRTLLGLLEDTCTSLLNCGFRRVFILNGHGGNDELIRVAAREVGVASRAVVAASSYWIIAWDRLRAAHVDELGRLPGHAGAFETSLLAAAHPGLASGDLPRGDGSNPRRERYYPDVHVEDMSVWEDGDGFFDSPARADPAVGATALELITAAVADAFVEVASTRTSSDPRSARSDPSAAPAGTTVEGENAVE